MKAPEAVRHGYLSPQRKGTKVDGHEFFVDHHAFVSFYCGTTRQNGPAFVFFVAGSSKA